MLCPNMPFSRQISSRYVDGCRYVERSLLKDIDERADATLDSSMSSTDQRSR